ncbi:Oligosaccharyltransferase subunit Ribophorin II-domain-containing protein [Tricharina praecox]|uniref:Oligosaccharyltransferase subunit Ribophorin II-domain-containing protein n=1 Tax=Tricharina praecox TaxID=43433 RepID=UPI00221EECB3|nr:Oligosaccharyltransferase subunit Ribophorin II-domain-containing protein [Tricharina praecox]KAI5855879.1 Oligosaccharyltransferase subunit Ribophorin II-domain-containing protein [Tricharina praecox]
MHTTTRTNMSLRSLLLLAVCSLAIASEWSFTGGKATLARKGDPEGSSLSFGPDKPFPSAIPLAARDVLKLQFTLTDGENTGRPHQAFLLVTDPETDLETFYPLSVKGNSGRAKVDLTHKDLPSHLLSASTLSLSLALGDNTLPSGSIIPLGSIAPTIDASAKTALEKQRATDLGEGVGAFGPKREILHVFREDAKSPPKTITLAFLASVVVAYLALFGAWFPLLGANLKHLPKALQAAPMSHSLFLVSLVALEGLFFMYYTSWNLFQLLGGVSVVGLTAFLSGSRALREVRARRERGER